MSRALRAMFAFADLLSAKNVSAAVSILAVVLCAAVAGSQERAPPAPPIGNAVAMAELMPFVAVQPDGRGLPEGRGDVKAGRALFQEQCAMCHGEQLQGIAATGAPALVGGRGSLTTVPAKKTVESYWPHATTLFDYIKRAMPFTRPGSLRDDEVYALCAYILASAQIVPDDAVMTRTSLLAVKMPNRGGFIPFDNRKVIKFH